MLSQNLKTKKGLAPLISTGLNFGANILNRSMEFRIAFYADIILEKPKVIPLPSFQLSLRIYPHSLYLNNKKQKEQNKLIKYAELLNENKEIKSDGIFDKRFKSIYVYFLPNSPKLDLNAKAQIKKVGEILKENQELLVLFEGSTANFGTAFARSKLEAERLASVINYLQKSYNIPNNRIIYTPNTKLKDELELDSKKKKYESEIYTQYRYVRIRFIKLTFDSNIDEKNVYKTKEVLDEEK